MYRAFTKFLAAGLTIGILTSCSEGRPPADPAVGPTLSLAGASGVSADVSRTVSLVDATGGETVVSDVDTTVWAPFNDDGAALVSDVDAGTPSPLGWRGNETFTAAYGSRYASFVDSTGVLHEMRVTSDAPGPWTRLEYRRGGTTVLEHESDWTPADGGYVLAVETVTYHLDGGIDLKVRLHGRHMSVARAGFDLSPLATATGALGAWLAPRPLAAQFYFGACSGDWLKWMGSALLAELAWARFVKSKWPSDFKKAAAATAAAGVALSGLVDCMVEQPEQPDPGN